jgi:hypothetical protein
MILLFGPHTNHAVHVLAQGPPTTGIVYTPPQYSDHVAVSLLLDPQVRALAAAAASAASAATATGGAGGATAAAKPFTAAAPGKGGGGGGGGSSSRSGGGSGFDAATRKCMPHLATASITSFFGKAKSLPSGATAAAAPPKTGAASAAASAASAAGDGVGGKRKGAGTPPLPAAKKGSLQSFFKK